MIITIVLAICLLLFLLAIYVSHVAQKAFDMGYKKALYDSSRHGRQYNTVEIGGETMTESQFNAARFPLL